MARTARGTGKAVAADKAPLSRERIEAAALDLIERDGLAGFSTRKLAGELGCEAMSIYHWFPSKGHLMDALVDRVVGEELTVPEPDGRDWRRRLEAIAREYRSLALRRPHFFGFLVMHRFNTPKGLAWLNGMLGFMTGIGLDPETAARTFRILGFYLAGALLDETAGYWRGHSTVDPVPDEVMRNAFPNVAAAGEWFAETRWEGTFELGLAVVIDGIGRMVDAGRRRRG